LLGGLCGENYQSDITNCYSTGVVNGDDYLGGLCGRNRESNITNCYSTGSVNGDSYFAGFCGYSDQGFFSNCYFLDTSGPNNGYGRPRSDAELKQQANFIDWDFNNFWDICEGTNYPRLIWQIPSRDFLCPDGVNFIDYAHFGKWWLDVACSAGNDFCSGADFDMSGIVDEQDAIIFCNNWLEGLGP